MRWVVYALLAINLGLLTWNLHTRAAPRITRAAPIVVAVQAETDALPLLSELDGEGLRARPTRAAVQVPATPAAAPAAAAAPAPAPRAGTPPAESPATGSATVAASPAPTSSEKAPAPPDTPLSEASPPTGVSSVVPADPKPASQACMTLGPLSATAEIPAMQSWLESRGARVEVRIDERREVALYWVFFPPRASRAAATQEVESMKSQGIEDIIVVPKGDMANAISLGVYSRTRSRDRRLAELNAKGYQPSIGPRYRTKVASWIDVSAETGALDRSAMQARWPGVRVTVTPCPGAPATPAAAVAGEGDTRESRARRFHFSGQATKQ